jgi:hypothetical protein
LKLAKIKIFGVSEYSSALKFEFFELVGPRGFCHKALQWVWGFEMYRFAQKNVVKVNTKYWGWLLGNRLGLIFKIIMVGIIWVKILVCSF